MIVIRHNAYLYYSYVVYLGGDTNKGKEHQIVADSVKCQTTIDSFLIAVVQGVPEKAPFLHFIHTTQDSRCLEDACCFTAKLYLFAEIIPIFEGSIQLIVSFLQYFIYSRLILIG